MEWHGTMRVVRIVDWVEIQVKGPTFPILCELIVDILEPLCGFSHRESNVLSVHLGPVDAALVMRNIRAFRVSGR